MSTSVAASSSYHSELKKPCGYDMFLSFRGSNTRKNFTDHLLKELKQNGYHPFHDRVINKGEYIDSELMKAIDDSRMSIILFSKHYADSKWCLDELVKIMDCRKYSQQIVLPVFLDVEPSDVRNQKGVFAQAFENHENYMEDDRVAKWRKAMKDAGKLSGLHLQNDANGYEAKLVDKIIEEVAKYLKQPCLYVAYHPVGIDSRMTKLIELLQMKTDDVRIVAVWGVGGLGKTTVAKATYNCIFSEFQSSSFLEDIKDSEKTALQNKLLVDLTTHKTPRINNVHRATEEIRRILMFQRVLVVLDDINHFEQLETLAINRRFFCPGSRIIITTRDIASVGSLKLDAVYSPDALNESESLKLFSLYAFGEGHPNKGYETLTKDVVQYASGIPLVLKTIGSSSSELSKLEWEDNLKKLKKIPNDDVQGKLKNSLLCQHGATIVEELFAILNRYEAKLVDKIIEEVAKYLKQPCLYVAYHPVGIDSRMTKLIELLQMKTDDVRIVAVWGVGGLGKTTVAKATYNCIFSEFQSSSFLEDIKDSEKTALQNKLLVDLTTHKTPRINNVHRATEEIRRILMFQRVLVVLDDINHFEQLETLAINRRFFCPGSRIIITTRDIASVGSLKLDAVYSPDALNESESLKLFSLYAFGEGHPNKGYETLTKDVVQYASGIPLVLKTIGSSSSELSKLEWEDNLKKLKKIPNDDVQGKLKVSFDSLGYEEKELFLNISCFFIGMEKDLMVKVMEDSNCFPNIGIKILVSRALVNIDGGVLSMHNLIRDMGREIVRQQSLKEPGKRSRLWDHDDISEVFRQCSGTPAVESIIHDDHNKFIPLDSVNIKAFEKMTNLKMLLLHYVCLHGVNNQMQSFRKLKYLQWHGFPLDSMPANLNMGNLVVMDLQYSRLKKLWEGTMKLDKLQFLNLSDSSFLTTTPDFSGMKNLEKLLLARCSKLVKLHSTVTCLHKLRILDLSYCEKLKETPNLIRILTLKSLEELYIYHCPKFKKNKDASTPQHATGSLLTKLSLVQCNLSLVPSVIERLASLVTLELHENKFSSLPALKNLHHLKQLTLSYCVRLQSIPDLPRNIVMIIAVKCISLRTLPSNMSDLYDLDELRLSGCKELGSQDRHCLMKLTGLGSLSFLEMDNCNVAHVPHEIGNLMSLNFLNLGGNNFSSLPASLGNLYRLLDLDLSDCIELQTVPALPRNLTSFKATNCIKLTSIPSNISDLRSLRELHLDGCSELGNRDPFCFRKLEGLSSLVYLNMKSCNLSIVPYEIEGLVSLSRLDLSKNIFPSVPPSLCNLQNLKQFELNDCVWLKSFPVLPPDFTVIKADNCRSLEMLPFKPFFLHGSGQELRFSRCPEWVGNKYIRNFKRYILQLHHELFRFQQVWPVLPEIRVSLSGTEIPDWCIYQGRGRFLSFVVPMDMDKKFSGWIYCAIAPNCKDDECQLKCKVVNKTKGRADYIGTTLCGYGPVFLAFVPHLIDLIPRLTFMVEGGDELVLGFELECKNNWEVQECGLCLIYEGDDSFLESNSQMVVEYTPSDWRQHLHQMVYKEKWEEFRETYLMYINSKADDDSDADGGGDSDDDHVSRDAGGGDGGGGGGSSSGGGCRDDQAYCLPTEGGPWYLLRPEELGEWLHDPLGS